MTKRKLCIGLAAALVISVLVASPAQAAVWSGSVVQSNPVPSAGSNVYTLTISSGATTTANAVKCVRIEFDTQADGAGTIPTGLNIGSATLSGSFTTAQTLSTFTPSYTNAGTGVVTYTNVTGGTGTNGTIILSAVTNGSTADDDFYIRYNTYNNTNCSSSPQDDFVAASIWTAGTTATVVIEPSLTYTVNTIAAASTCNGVTTTDASTSSAFTLRPTLAANKVAGQRHDVATNASGGYSLYMRHSQLPTSGGNDIDALGTHTYGTPGNFSASGTEAWGFSTNDATLAGGTGNRFTNGGAKWAPLTTSSPGDVVADAAAPGSAQTQVCFQVGASSTTPAGTYTTAITYTAAGNF